MPRMRDRDVAVVGLGPVGAVSALLLARAGIRVAALDAREAPGRQGRAVALDEETIAVLRWAGRGEDWALALRPGSSVALTGREGRALVEVPAGHLAFFHQPELERALWEALEEHPGVDLRPGTPVRDPAALGARWVLGCDGAHSTVRRELGLSLRGRTARQRWVVADTAGAADAPPGTPFTFRCDPRRPRVAGPLPGGRWRREGMLAPGEKLPEDPAGLVGAGPGERVERAAAYRAHARVAARWRSGRALLLGDAAHLMPPFGGQGLASGLRDAANLAWKLAAVLRGEAGEELLESYEEERRPQLRATLARSVALGAVVEVTSPAAARARDAALAGGWRLRPLRAWAERGGWRPDAAAGGVPNAAYGWTLRGGEGLSGAARRDLEALGGRREQAGGAGFALLRPDGVVAARGAASRLDEALREVRAQLDRGRAPRAG